MTKKEITQLYTLLDKLETEMPCKAKGCVGHLNCECGINGAYGEECAIDTIRNTLHYLYYTNNKN